MKKAFLTLLIISAMSLSCSSEEKGPDPTPIVNAMSQGSWRITEYVVDGTIPVTDNFTNWTFAFAPDDILTASDGTISYSGAWSVRNFDNDRLKFTIAFANPEILTYLNNSWRIRFRSSEKIILDINEFNYLVFEKN